MEFSVFKKAGHFVDSDKITAQGFGNDRSFWKVGENDVELRQDRDGFDAICTCKHSTIRSVNSPSCSHVIALITYLTLKKKEIIKK